MPQPVVYIDAQFIATPEMGALADEVAILWDLSDSMKPFYRKYAKLRKWFCDFRFLASTTSTV